MSTADHLWPNLAPTRPVPVWLSAAIFVLVAVYAAINLEITIAHTNWGDYGTAVKHVAAVRGSSPPAVRTWVIVLLALVYLVNAAFLVGIPIWFGWLAARGRRWARIALTVYVAFTLALAAYVALSPGQKFTHDPIAILLNLLEVIAAILLWIPPSNRYYGAWRSYRQEQGLRHSRSTGLTTPRRRLPTKGARN